MRALSCIAMSSLAVLALGTWLGDAIAQSNYAPRKSWSDVEIEQSLPRVKRFTDRILGAHYFSTQKERELGGDNVLGLDRFTIQPVFGEWVDGRRASYHLTIRYRGLGWIFMNGTVHFLIDDSTRVTLEGPGSENDREVEYCTASTCMVSETMRLPATVDLIEQLAMAHSVEVRIDGSKGYVNRWLKRDALADVRALFQCVQADSLPR